MSRPFLTIGCAVFRDLEGLYFTLQSLRLYHLPHLPPCEIVVVDNDPSGRDKQTIHSLVGWMATGGTDAKYVFAPEAVGTSAPRQRLFDVASGKYVVCLDSHVLLDPFALTSLVDYYKENPDTSDLIQGPLLYDDLKSVSTHWEDYWRSEMWGTWGKDPRGDRTTPTYQTKPFEIWACGLGLFSCRKDAWLGFNPRFRGFGGEEGYIHEKFRKAGHQALCLPPLRWVHLFNRPNGVPYPLRLWDKVRNYVIGHHELGLTFDRMKRHFIDRINEDGTPLGGNPFPQREWDLLMQDPANPPDWPPWIAKPDAPTSMHLAPPASVQPMTKPACGACAQKMSESITLDALYVRAKDNPSDINEHCPKLKELAAGCDHVTEFGMRHGVSTVALLAGQPKKFVSYDLVIDPIAKELKDREGKTEFVFVQGNSLTAEIEETDLLFIDTRHTADQLYTELKRHHEKVRRWIALHDTDVFGERGEDGGPGLLPALRRFVQEHPEWSVIYHVTNNHGFTVISRLPEDRPKLPSNLKMAWNYAKAQVNHLLAGSKLATEEQSKARLDICATCPLRVEHRCSVCGCFLDEVPEGTVGAKAGPGRAWYAEAGCPVGHWHAVTSPQEKEVANG